MSNPMPSRYPLFRGVLPNLCLLSLLIFSSVDRPAKAGTPTTPANNARSAYGINLTKLSYWSSQWTLIDIMKHASISGGKLWATSNRSAFNTQEYALLDLDKDGWPRSLPDASSRALFRSVTTSLYHDNIHHPGGKFTVLYDGTGTLRYTGAQVIASESKPGRHVLQVAENASFFLHIDATDPQKTGDYVRNIRVLVPGGICYGDASHYAADMNVCPGSFTPFENIANQQHIHPLLLKDLKNFRVLRFMEFLNTIANPIQQWSQRTKPEHASWGLQGAPLELALEMSNTVQAEPWLNIPVQVDDEYIRQYAKVVKSKLAPHLKFYLEFGNEIWNSAWPYIQDARIMEQRAKLTWPNSTASLFELRLNYYGKRTSEMCSIVKQEFGEQAARVQCVMGGQSGSSWVANQSLACPIWAAQRGGENCAGQMSALAIAPYFGGYLANDRFLPAVAQWAKSGSTGLNNVFDEMQRGVLYQQTYDPTWQAWQQAPQEGALAKAEGEMRQNKQVANRYGLDLVAYEGGQHFSFAGNMQGDRATVNTNLFLAANRDPRMGQVYRDHLADWRSAGGTLYVMFESIGRWGNYGAFPLKEYQTQPSQNAIKWQTVQDEMLMHPCWWNGCSRVVHP